MKKILFLCMGCICASNAIAAPAGRGRVSMSEQMFGGVESVVTSSRDASPRDTSSRATVSKAQIAVMALENGKSPSDTSVSSLAVTPEQMLPATKIEMYEDMRDACLANNMGLGNTFVWASRYSNVDDYTSMIEDVENPDNNVCFVKITLKSDDEKVDLSDVEGRYFQMGRNIVCGSWLNKSEIEQRILDAKKAGRVLGGIGAAVAGAGVGVGAMELFGNKAIGGKVEGQKSMSDIDFWKLKLNELKSADSAKYNEFVEELKNLKEACEKVVSKVLDSSTSNMCKKFEGLYEFIPQSE
jgi:hypothetical protein